MRKKVNKKGSKIVRNMKQCFRSLHLPVENAKAGELYDFKSKIDNANTLAEVIVEYRPDFNCVNINFNLGVMKTGNIDEIKKLINLINGITPFCQFSLCPCCNEIILHANLFVSNNKLQKDKFDWLLRYMLEIAHLAYPGISMLVFKGGTAEKYYDICKDNIWNVTYREQGLDKEMKEKVLNGLASIFADLKFTVTDENRIENGFIFSCAHPSEPGLCINMITALDTEDSTVIIHAVSSFTVPDDKMTAIIELVNRINRLCGYQHLFVDSLGKRSVFLYGIRLDNGVLPEEEFQNAFKVMITDALCWFPILQELVTSGGLAADLIRKRLPCYNDRLTMY